MSRMKQRRHQNARLKKHGRAANAEYDSMQPSAPLYRVSVIYRQTLREPLITVI